MLLMRIKMPKKNVIKAVMYVEEDPITMPYDKLDKLFKARCKEGKINHYSVVSNPKKVKKA